MGATTIGALHPDDAAALRAAARDPAAFAALYRRYVDDVYRYLAVKCGADAEDLVADTFVVALRSGTSYRGAGSVKAWLIGIARRKAADFHRSRRPTEPLDAAASLPDPVRTEDVAAQRRERARSRSPRPWCWSPPPSLRRSRRPRTRRASCAMPSAPRCPARPRSRATAAPSAGRAGRARAASARPRRRPSRKRYRRSCRTSS